MCLPNLILPWTWNILSSVNGLPYFPSYTFLSVSIYFTLLQPKENKRFLLCLGSCSVESVALSVISHILWLFLMFSYCIVTPPSAARSSWPRMTMVSFLTLPKGFAWCALCTRLPPSFAALQPFASIPWPKCLSLSWYQPTAGRDTLNKPSGWIRYHIWFACVCEGHVLWFFKMTSHRSAVQASQIQSEGLPQGMNTWCLQQEYIKVKSLGWVSIFVHQNLPADGFKDATFTPKLANYIWKGNQPKNNEGRGGRGDVSVCNTYHAPCTFCGLSHFLLTV